MKVLMTPHVEHYTIGLSEELSKYVDVTLLTSKQFHTRVKQIIVPSSTIPYFSILVKYIVFKLIGAHYDVIHVNSSLDGLLIGNFNRLLVTEHGCPDPRVVEKSEQKYYLRERNALLKLYEIGVPLVTVSKYSAEMLAKPMELKFEM